MKILKLLHKLFNRPKVLFSYTSSFKIQKEWKTVTYNVQYTLYIVQGTVHSAQCKVYTAINCIARNTKLECSKPVYVIKMFASVLKPRPPTTILQNI